MAINLGGTADITLVQGARALAREKHRVIEEPVDRTGAIVGSAIGSIADAVLSIKKKKEQLEIEHEKQLESFVVIAEKANQILAEQKEPLPQKVVDAVQREIERLQDEYQAVNVVGKNDTRENKRARTKIMAELARVTNEAINTRANFMTIGRNAGNFNSSRINPNDIDPIKSILDLDNMDKNDNISVDFVDGKLTFNTKNYTTGQVRGKVEQLESKYTPGKPGWSVTESREDDPGPFKPGKEQVIEEYQYGDARSFTAEEMTNALPTKNLEIDAMILESTSNFTKQGINDGRYGAPNYFRNIDGTLNEFAYNDEKNAMAGEITKEVFQDIEGRRVTKMGMPSFRMALRDRIDIPVAALDNMFVDQNGRRVQFSDIYASLDKNEDGFINQKDLFDLESGEVTAFEENLDKIIDALTNVDNPAFNLETSADMLADYYTNMKMQAYENRYYAYGGKKIAPTTTEEGEQLNFGNEGSKQEE